MAPDGAPNGGRTAQDWVKACAEFSELARSNWAHKTRINERKARIIDNKTPFNQHSRLVLLNWLSMAFRAAKPALGRGYVPP